MVAGNVDVDVDVVYVDADVDVLTYMELLRGYCWS